MAIGVALLVALGVPMGAGKAMAIGPGNCTGAHFSLAHSNDVNQANSTEGPMLVLGGGLLTFGHVNGGAGPVLCQAMVGSNVIIYDTSASPSGECLAYNASTDEMYLHNPNGCNGTSATYLQWRFKYVETARGYKIYDLQNMYAPKGDPCAEFSFGAPPQYNPVYGIPCNTNDTNQFMIYEPL
jgi:hypothetical protein